jgi:hypothetical protein
MDLTPVLILAARYANDDTRIRTDDGGLPANVRNAITFSASPNRPNKLELFFDAETLNGTLQLAHRNKQILLSDDEVYDLLTQVATDAVQRALNDYENGRFFAALIVENLRSGRDTLATGTDD